MRWHRCRATGRTQRGLPRTGPAAARPSAGCVLHYAELAREQFQRAGVPLLGSHVAVVDRSPQVQAILVYWVALGEPALLIGASPVSTGRVGQFDHFETPLGVFDHSLSNPDFRAEGTRNEFGFRGYGAKGMRVYDLGWQKARRGWGKGGDSTMRLQMHATDPVLAEHKLGSVQSRAASGFQRRQPAARSFRCARCRL